MFRSQPLLLMAVVVAAVAVTVALPLFGGGKGDIAFAAPSPKATICHHTSSVTNPWVQINVSQNALPAHFTHGDFVVTATNPCPPPPCPVNDTIIDADGTASPGDGVPAAVETVCGMPLASFPTATFIGSGLDWFDNDGNGAWTLGSSGDDLHVEDFTFCPTAIRDAIHQVGADCVVLDIDGSLFTGQPVDCDLEVDAAFSGAFPGSCASPITNVRYHDANGNGAWDNGEDIVLDGNGNGVFD